MVLALSASFSLSHTSTDTSWPLRVGWWKHPYPITHDWPQRRQVSLASFERRPGGIVLLLTNSSALICQTINPKTRVQSLLKSFTYLLSCNTTTTLTYKKRWKNLQHELLQVVWSEGNIFPDYKTMLSQQPTGVQLQCKPKSTVSDWRTEWLSSIRLRYVVTHGWIWWCLYNVMQWT